MELTLRRCTPADEPRMSEIICDAAQAFKDVIPEDRWHDPYMPLEELRAEIAAGVEFWGAELVDAEGRAELVGVMGLQDVDSRDTESAMGGVTLIRHAYVRTALRGQGVGGRLLKHLLGLARRPVLLGTWAAAEWAVRFYLKHGFILTSQAEKETLLRTYWNIPERQVATSVVLAHASALAMLRGADMRKISAKEEFASIDAFWSPRTVGELNGQLVKFVRLKGEFQWHKHTDEDEMFWVLEGSLTIRLRGQDITLGRDEFFIIPRGVEHMPVCKDECRIMLFEPAATKQHGD